MPRQRTETFNSPADLKVIKNDQLNIYLSCVVRKTPDRVLLAMTAHFSFGIGGEAREKWTAHRDKVQQ